MLEEGPDKIILEAFARRLGIDLSDVSIIPIKGNGKGNPARPLDAWLAQMNAAIPVYLIVDADAGAEAAQLIEKKPIPLEQVHVWKAGAIDSYYPIEILKDALQAISTRYSLNLNVNKFVQEVRDRKTHPNAIDIGDKVKHLDSSWEMTLATEVAAGLDKSHAELPTEIRDTLLAATASTT